MCYGNNDDFNDCVSVCSNGIENIKLVFEAIGYEFEYINQKELNSNKEKYYLFKRTKNRSLNIISNKQKTINPNFIVSSK